MFDEIAEKANWSKNQKAVLLSLFGGPRPKSYIDVAHEFGVTKERIHQIHYQAMQKLAAVKIEDEVKLLWKLDADRNWSVCEWLKAMPRFFQVIKEDAEKAERKRIEQQLVDVSTVNECDFPPKIVSLTMTYDKWLELGFPDWQALKQK